MENEIQNTIYYNENFGDLDIETQFQALGEGAYLLALAIAEEDNNVSEKFFNLAANLFRSPIKCDYFWELYHAARIEKAYRSQIKMGEFVLQTKFKECAKKIIDGAEIVSGPSTVKNRPDAWVKIFGDMIPVEVKRGEFNKKALDQLNRYVSAFGSKYGVAVGEKLTCKLPENYIFVSKDEINAALESNDTF